MASRISRRPLSPPVDSSAKLGFSGERRGLRHEGGGRIARRVVEAVGLAGQRARRQYGGDLADERGAHLRFAGGRLARHGCRHVACRSLRGFAPLSGPIPPRYAPLATAAQAPRGESNGASGLPESKAILLRLSVAVSA
jgi:hypothetical protein